MKNVMGTLKNLVMSLPFGMKAADSEIMGTGDSTLGEGTTISQEVTKNTLADALLKGEVTQEVEELRYGMYKACREADNYLYVGGGAAIKKEKKHHGEKIKFTQENKLICSDVLTELKRVNSYGTEAYTVALGYESIPKIKIEKYLTSVDVTLEEGKKAITVFNFSEHPNKMDFSSKPFVASLESLYKAYESDDKYFITRSDFSSIITMNFTTHNSKGDELDVICYMFISPVMKSVRKENGQYRVEYEWDSYNREDLTDKFFSKEMQEKYDKKAARSTTTQFDANRKYYCASCGVEITESEANHMKDKEMKPLCYQCYYDYLVKNSDLAIFSTNDSNKNYLFNKQEDKK